MMKKIELSYTFVIVAFGFVITGHFINLIIFFSIILIHELGHVFMAKLFNVKIEKIIFYPYGGITKFSYLLNINIYKELLISIGGFLFQWLFFAFIYYLYNIGILREYTYTIFHKYHISIFIFNLFPIIPLDGFKIINLLLNYLFCFNISNYLSVIISIISLIFCLYLFNNINYSFILILFILFKNIFEFLLFIKYLYFKFLLERYLYNIKYNKLKIIKDIKNLYRDKSHYIKIGNYYISEKDCLKKYIKKRD